MQNSRRDTLPAPWTAQPITWAGGIIGVGFARETDLLLVATHDGRGVVNCLTGEMIARDRDPSFLLDEKTRKVPGIGPLAGEEIVIAGKIYGGTLSNKTKDGWVLRGELSNRSDDSIWLLPPIDDVNTITRPMLFTGFIPEIRVFGFSPTGRCFIIGTGAEVFSFAR